MGENLLDEYKGRHVPDQVAKETQLYKENVHWINAVKKAGYTILDLGGNKEESTFYNMETETVYGTKK